LCQFDEFFDEQITDEKGEHKSYFNFSGGERKRIDLACLFSFLDIRRMQGDVHFSTIFYDELLDSSLDDKGVELVLDVLRERALKHNENCYIITHRGTTITEKIDNTIFLEKRNNFTYLLS
jgi:energy-coupling factor transporter ATP-binding protein EcfA2